MEKQTTPIRRLDNFRSAGKTQNEISGVSFIKNRIIDAAISSSQKVKIRGCDIDTVIDVPVIYMSMFQFFNSYTSRWNFDKLQMNICNLPVPFELCLQIPVIANKLITGTVINDLHTMMDLLRLADILGLEKKITRNFIRHIKMYVKCNVWNASYEILCEIRPLEREKPLFAELISYISVEIIKKLYPYEHGEFTGIPHKFIETQVTRSVLCNLIKNSKYQILQMVHVVLILISGEIDVHKQTPTIQITKPIYDLIAAINWKFVDTAQIDLLVKILSELPDFVIPSRLHDACSFRASILSHGLRYTPNLGTLDLPEHQQYVQTFDEEVKKVWLYDTKTLDTLSGVLLYSKFDNQTHMQLIGISARNAKITFSLSVDDTKHVFFSTSVESGNCGKIVFRYCLHEQYRGKKIVIVFHTITYKPLASSH